MLASRFEMSNFRFQVYISGLDFRLRFQVLDLRFGFEAWGIWLLKLGEPLGGSRGNPAGPRATPGL